MRKSKQQLGFTLAEVAIAIALLAMVLVGAFKFITDSITFGKITGEKIQAYYLAQQGIEAVRSYNRQSPTNTLSDGDHSPSFSSTTWYLDGGANPVKLDNIDFTRVINIATADPSGLKKITSTITWQNGKQSIELVTYMKD